MSDSTANADMLTFQCPSRLTAVESYSTWQLPVLLLSLERQEGLFAVDLGSLFGSLHNFTLAGGVVQVFAPRQTWILLMSHPKLRPAWPSPSFAGLLAQPFSKPQQLPHWHI